jgi:hypothetical protein
MTRLRLLIPAHLVLVLISMCGCVIQTKTLIPVGVQVVKPVLKPALRMWVVEGQEALHLQDLLR